MLPSTAAIRVVFLAKALQTFLVPPTLLSTISSCASIVCECGPGSMVRPRIQQKRVDRIVVHQAGVLQEEEEDRHCPIRHIADFATAAWRAECWGREPKP